MNTIKNCIALFLFVALAATFNAPAAYAQTGGMSKNEFFLKANEVDSAVVMLLPAVQKVREAAARASLQTIIKNTSVVCRKVKTAGPRMTDAQLATFQREFESINNQLAAFASTHTKGNRSVEECLRECGPIKNNPGAAQCRYECISGWLTSAGGGSSN
ncbi:MAG: hypothetical protein JNM22_03485 [Saprospiraceae bacterium]|nr:hypothetical protein [Saprospiraceae bacterium]